MPIYYNIGHLCGPYNTDVVGKYIQGGKNKWD